MIEWIFWIGVALVAYGYGGFPLLLMVRAKLCRSSYVLQEITPSVSLIIVAHNEERSLPDKLKNIGALDYPADQLEILLASDGSTDATVDIMRAAKLKHAKVLALPRQGKIGCLNAAVAEASGEVLVFSDANSMFAADALLQLMRPLADPSVGGVAGDQRYLRSSSRGATGEHAYWNFDRHLKTLEAAAGNVISATGAIYVIRRALFRPVPAGVTDDFVISTRVIEQGQRLVFAPDAAAYEPAAVSGNVECARKVRIMTRGFRSLWVMRRLFLPHQYGFYSLQIFSHKLLRRLMILPLLFVLLASIALVHEGWLYAVALAMQVAVYGLGLAGAIVASFKLRPPKILAVPFFFCMANIAALLALLNVLRGRQVNLWQPQRSEPAIS